MADNPPLRSRAPSPGIPSVDMRRVIGIYGIPGSGKSFLLHQLKQKLPSTQFELLEGSRLIDMVTPGGLVAFQTMSEQEKTRWRQDAIKLVATSGSKNNTTAIIAGHYMFWRETEAVGTVVMTRHDILTYNHILYLDVPADVIMRRRRDDLLRNRPQESLSHLVKWQQTEKYELRRLCYDHGILFSVVSEVPRLFEQVSKLLTEFKYHNEAYNRDILERELDRVFTASKEQWKTLIVLDADKTLTAIDTGELFWKKVNDKWPSKVAESPLKEIFTSKLQYTHTAFVQAMLVYQETLDHEQFKEVCNAVAAETVMYPEFVSLLQTIAEKSEVGAVVITCGLRQVWKTVLERHGLSDKVRVIGGGRLVNKYVVTGDAKGRLILHAKHFHHTHVCAFGDSSLDLEMLEEADQAIVVVGEESTRSASMEYALDEAIEHRGLRAHQVVLPNTASPRLTLDKLPTLQLTDSEFIRQLIPIQSSQTKLDIVHATSKTAAKLLMTPMRDARVAGPRLREVHRLVGHYLATELLSTVIGVEEYSIPHVQGHHVAGHRFRHEKQTLIVPLMRGGEPMAFGVNDAMPEAMFLHANQPEDIRCEHVHGRLSVILVDSVVNSGKSLLEFVQHIRKMHATVRIVAMAGVVQEGAVARLQQEPCCLLNFKLIALHLSENKFTGKGVTDTGNRLFNTPHLD